MHAPAGVVQDGLGLSTLDDILFIGHVINTGLRGAYLLFGALEQVWRVVFGGGKCIIGYSIFKCI